MFSNKQMNTSNKETKEESPDISEEQSDESDSEGNEGSEELEMPAEERQGTGSKSCDVKRDSDELSSEGGVNELKSERSVSVPLGPSVEEIETVSIGGPSTQSQLFGGQGIFSGSQTHDGKRVGPLITEIVMEEGNLQAILECELLSMTHVFSWIIALGYEAFWTGAIISINLCRLFKEQLFWEKIKGAIVQRWAMV